MIWVDLHHASDLFDTNSFFEYARARYDALIVRGIMMPYTSGDTHHASIPEFGRAENLSKMISHYKVDKTKEWKMDCFIVR